MPGQVKCLTAGATITSVKFWQEDKIPSKKFLILGKRPVCLSNTNISQTWHSY
jgi:hypothetical protein